MISTCWSHYANNSTNQKDYSDKLEKNTVCVVKVNGQLIAAETREDLQYVHLPNGEDNPLLDTDY